MLGYWALIIKDFARARDFFQQATARFEQIQGWEGVAECLEGFAELAVAEGDPQNAAAAWQRAAEYYEKLGMPLRAKPCWDQAEGAKGG